MSKRSNNVKLLSTSGIEFLSGSHLSEISKLIHSRRTQLREIECRFYPIEAGVAIAWAMSATSRMALTSCTLMIDAPFVTAVATVAAVP